MEENKYPTDISERQKDIINHFINVLGVDLNKMQYFKSSINESVPFSIDIAVFEPTKNYEYYVLSTVGLSHYYFPKNFARAELMMLLPKNWKPNINSKQYGWAINMLTDIAYQIIEDNAGVFLGQFYVFNGGKKTYSEGTDAVGGIVCIPEMFPLDIIETEILKSYTRFFQFMTITKEDVSKIAEIGPIEFIKYDLHDSDGPLMVVPIKDKVLNGIDKIIKTNENNLKKKS